MNEDAETPIKMTDVFSALALRDLLQAADMRDVEERVHQLGDRTAEFMNSDLVGGDPEAQP